MSALLKKHAIFSAIGLVLGLLALAWIQPLTPGGVSLVLLVVVTLINAVALLAPTNRSKPAIPATKKKSVAKK